MVVHTMRGRMTKQTKHETKEFCIFITKQGVCSISHNIYWTVELKGRHNK